MDWRTVLEDLIKLTTAEGASPEVALRDVLDLGRRVLGTRAALAARVDETTVRLDMTSGGEDIIHPGQIWSIDSVHHSFLSAWRDAYYFTGAHTSDPGLDNSGFADFGVKSFIGAPVFVNGARYGLICFLSRAEQNEAFSPDDLKLVQMLASIAAGAIARSIQDSQAEAHREALEAANARLQESNAALNCFAASASHDMREPLRKIKAFGDLLERDYAEALDQRGRDYLGYMISASDRLARLIEDALRFARLSGRPAKAQPVDMDAVIDDVLYDLELKIEEAGSRISAEPVGWVVGDETMLRSVIQNLIENALKYRDTGRQSEITITPSIDGDYIRIAVQDNGLGFPSEYAESILEPFRRLGSESAREGSGIGLAIVRAIIDRHGGQLSVKGAPGEGACFTFTLPRHIEAQAAE